MFVCTDADIGGAERLLAMIGNAWSSVDARGEDRLRLVVVMRPGTLSPQLEEAFDEVVYLGFPPSSRNLPGMVRALNRQIADFSPDLISSHLFHADLITALARKRAPKTTTMHTQGLGPDDHPLTRIIAKTVGVLSGRFAAVIPSSDSADMASFMRKLKMKHLSTPILNGSEVSETSSFDRASRRFLSIARNHPVKGHRVLFEAFASIAADHPEWTLRAYGPGVVESDPRMRDAIEHAGATELLAAGRIELLGPTNTPGAVLKTGSALVISSLYGESLPLIGAEAAGAGIPVITTDNGSCREFADDPGFCVRADSVPALAEALARYASLSDDEREHLSAIAHERARSRYSPARVASEYRARFAEVIRGR